MIVLMSVKVTDHRLGTYHRGAWYPDSGRFDVFKYCLASHAVLEPVVDKFVFYIDLAELSHRQDELEAYMLSIFPAEKLEITWQRLNHTHEWRAAAEKFTDDELIWYSGNDDHIFIDHDLDMIQSAITTLNADPDPMAIMYYSHFPEQMRNSLRLGGELTADGNFIKFPWENFDAIQLMKAGRFKKYWFDTDGGDNVIYRSDFLDKYGLSIQHNVYAPTKELVRHYDGYSHVGSGCVNIAPPLFIPPGFFEDHMNIRIGFNDRKEDWTNFNPAAEWLYNFNPDGTDYRWLEEDIPLFWRSHLGEIVYSPEFNETFMHQARDAAFLAMTRVPMNPYGHEFGHEGHPAEWFQKHFIYKE